MIIILTTSAHRYTIAGLRELPETRNTVCWRSYGWLFRQTHVTAGAVIFTDMDRLFGAAFIRAGEIAVRLRAAGIDIINPPSEVLQRHALLRALHRDGHNPFNVYRADDRPRPARFPVFLKAENAHASLIGELCHDQAELDGLMEATVRSGIGLRDLIVTEFANDPVRDGVWRKETLYRIGDVLIAAPGVSEDRPIVKYGKKGLATEEDFQQGVDVARENRHPPEAMAVFEAARIRFGRADYGWCGGRPSWFEINTNPTLPTLSKLSYRHAGFEEAHRETARKVGAAIADLDRPDRRVRVARMGELKQTLDLAWRPWPRDP